MGKQQRKIGILTYIKEYNCGQFLQTLGTYRTLKELCPSYQSEFIDITYNGSRLVPRSYCIPFGKPKGTYWAMWQFLTAWRMLPMSHRRLATRDYEEATEFINSLNYSVIVLGSDVTLRMYPNSLVSGEALPFYWLSPKIRARKCMLSSSADVLDYEALTDKQRDMMRASALGFRFLSVRDDHTSLLLQKLGILATRISITPDPAFTLDLSSDNRVERQAMKMRRRVGGGGRQIIGIRLGRERQPWKDELILALNTAGFHVVSYQPYPGARYLGDVGPRDWMAFMRSIDLMLTYSFHETIVCMKIGKPVISLVALKRLVDSKTGNGKLPTLHDQMQTRKECLVNPWSTHPPTAKEMLERVQERLQANDTAEIQERAQAMGARYVSTVQRMIRALEM